MIEINNELSNNLGYSSVRYLKSAITRLFGQNSIINNHISKEKFIFLAGKRNKIALLDLVKSNSNDTYTKAKELAHEINVRYGVSNKPYFYGDCDNIGAILYDMYRNNEITKSEFINCIIDSIALGDTVEKVYENVNNLNQLDDSEKSLLINGVYGADRQSKDFYVDHVVIDNCFQIDWKIQY